MTVSPMHRSALGWNTYVSTYHTHVYQNRADFRALTHIAPPALFTTPETIRTESGRPFTRSYRTKSRCRNPHALDSISSCHATKPHANQVRSHPKLTLHFLPPLEFHTSNFNFTPSLPATTQQAIVNYNSALHSHAHSADPPIRLDRPVTSCVPPTRCNSPLDFAPNQLHRRTHTGQTTFHSK